MKTNQNWQLTTVTRSISVVPVHGFGMGDVRPQVDGRFSNGIVADMSAKKRHAAAATATVWGPQPWSPPVR